MVKENFQFGAAVQARRLYLYVLNGGSVKVHDMEYLVKLIEEMEQALCDAKIGFASRSV